MTAAHRYNERQGYTRRLVSWLQEQAGAPALGRWRKDDVGAVAELQRELGVAVDGMAGPQTVMAAAEQRGILADVDELGVWWDHSPMSHIQMMRDIGVRRLCLMVNRSSTLAWRNERTLIDVAKHAARRDMATTLTVWVRPELQSIRDAYRWLDRMVPETGADEVEWELEGNWHPRHARSPDAFVEAERLLVELSRELTRAHCRLRVGSTTYLGAYAATEESVWVVPRLAFFTPQLYSRHKDGHRLYSWGARYGPGTMQEAEAPTTWGLVDHDDTEVVWGLAAYGQSFPSHDPVFAQLLAAAEVALYTPSHDRCRLRYWSAKHVTPHGYTASYFQRFLSRD